MFTVYVLYSRAHHKTYTGYSANFSERLKAHNVLARKGWTVRYRPWLVLHTEVCTTKQQAMLREQELKQGKGREFIQWLLQQISK